jgi:hypothetical protein
METTLRYVNGVAISCHPHLNWRKGAQILIDAGVYTNFHIIINDEASVDRLLSIRDEFRGRVKYFVLLPQMAQGRAKSGFNQQTWEYLRAKLGDCDQDIAFGALLHPYLQDVDWDISIYDPESMSKYLVMDDSMKLYPSSFSTGN